MASMLSHVPFKDLPCTEPCWVPGLLVLALLVSSSQDWHGRCCGGIHGGASMRWNRKGTEEARPRVPRGVLVGRL